MENAKAIGASVMMIFTSILVVAILAVLVSGNSQTASVVQSFGETFSKILGVVVAPIGSSSSGGSTSGSGISPINSQGAFTVPTFAQ